MPISMDDLRYPKFIDIPKTYPFSEDRKAKYIDTHDHPRCFRNGDYPMPGYNPNLNDPNPIRINIDREDLTLPPY